MNHYIAIPTCSSLGIFPHVRLWNKLKEWKLQADLVDNFMPQWRARQAIVSKFLNSNSEFLTMIDCDTVPHALVFRDFAARKDAIIAGHYALYTTETMFQFSVGKRRDVGTLGGNRVYQFSPTVPEGWSEWDCAGFGCVTMPRGVVERLAITGVFDVPPNPGNTEDEPVCFQARGMGIKIMTHSSLRCEHWRNVDITQALEIQNVLIEEGKLDKWPREFLKRG